MLMPVIFFTAMNNLIWAIGLEVTLSVLGVLGHQPADHWRDDLLG